MQAIALVLVWPASTLAAPLSYTAIALGTLQGWESYGSSINNRGQITGTFQLSKDGPAHAFLYSNGVMTNLGTLGGTDSRAYSINNRGEITGSSLPSGNGPGHGHAFLYSDGVMTDLGTLGGTNSTTP